MLPPAWLDLTEFVSSPITPPLSLPAKNSMGLRSVQTAKILDRAFTTGLVVMIIGAPSLFWFSAKASLCMLAVGFIVCVTCLLLVSNAERPHQ